jgi:hypothetical protein
VKGGLSVLSGTKASGLQFVALKPAMQREVFMMLRRDRELNPSARAFANAVRTGLMQAVLHGSVQLEAAD